MRTAPGTPGLHRADEVIPQGGDLGRTVPLRAPGERERRRERHSPGHVLGPRPAPAFLPAAVDHGFQPGPAPHEQGPASFRGAEFVAGDAQGVHAQCCGVERQPAGGLDRVGVEGYALRAGQRGQPGDRLHRAHLIVGVHDADQGGFRPEHGGEGLLGDAAVGVHRHHVDGEAVHPLQVAGGLLHGGMFDGADHHPVQPRVRGPPGQRNALDGEVVRLRAAGGEDHLARAAAQRLGRCCPAPRRAPWRPRRRANGGSRDCRSPR